MVSPEWKKKRNDELDDLGGAFNIMAENVEEKVETITKLNDQIQHELLIGKEVQELFLPSDNTLKEYGVACYYRPLREVSGDIYNFFEFAEHIKGVFFADATGHGISAALITAVTAMSLDEVVRRTQNPIEVLGTLNNMVSDRLQSSFYATAVFFLFDSRKKKVYYSNAGHNAPLLIRKQTKQIVELGKCGPPLGMIDDVDYQGKKFFPQTGDKLLIYSDGLVETENTEKDQFGMERVEGIVKENFGLPNEELLSILTGELEEHAAYYRDDVSVVLMEMP